MLAERLARERECLQPLAAANSLPSGVLRGVAGGVSVLGLAFMLVLSWPDHGRRQPTVTSEPRSVAVAVPAIPELSTSAPTEQAAIDGAAGGRSASPAPRARTQQRAKPAAAGKVEPAQGELSLLQRAQSALDHDARAALDLTEQHRRSYPHGIFSEEREMLAIEALQKQRRTRAAVERARAFVTSYPRSPHARRVQALLDSAATSPGL
jgi:hypothetical protein